MKTDAYWEGYLAKQAGKERYCVNPWNVQYQHEWMTGWDDANMEEVESGYL